MGLCGTVSEIDGDFSRKSQKKNSHPLVFCVPADILGTGAGGQNNYNVEATGPSKKFDDIFSRVDTMHQRDRQTDGHRATEKTALTHSIAR